MNPSDLIDKHAAVIELFLGMVVLALFIRLAGDPVNELLRDIAREFRELVTQADTPRALNALGGIAMLIIALAIIIVGPLDFLGGQISGKGDEQSLVIARYGIAAFFVAAIGPYFLLSVKMTR